MHRHLAIDQRSRGESWLHRRDARAKLAVLLAFLIVVSSTPASSDWFAARFLAYGALLLAATLTSKLPLGGLALRVLLVLPFSLTLAALAYWSGEPVRAVALVLKSYLSAYASLLFVSTTPVEAWTVALERWHVPQTLILVVQFLYRYLFLMVDQAHRMLRASALRRGVQSRGGRYGSGGFEVAGAMVGVLFARSWQRADWVYQAMLARGFQGRFSASEQSRFQPADAAFLSLGVTASVAARWLLG